MSPRSRARVVLVILLGLVPIATALPGADLTAGVLPAELQGVGTALSIQEENFLFEGRAESPQHVRLLAPDGSTALEYRLHPDGRARLDVAGATALQDATLIAVEGDPLGDAFSLVLMDAAGGQHVANVDRAALRSAAALGALPLPPELPAGVDAPSAAPLPLATITRPPAWPGAPKQPYLLFVEDQAGNHRDANALDGNTWLKYAGRHRAAVQVPLDDARFDRVYLQVGGGTEPTQNASFEVIRTTADAQVYQARFAPDDLGIADGGALTLRPVYETRPLPPIVERFPEARTYRYKVDATGPSVSVVAPPLADDFVFALVWDGRDAGSGLGGATIDFREAGAVAWTPWLTRSPAKTATFSGDWDRTYEFRVVAVDAVGNPSTPATATTRVGPRPGSSNDVNDPPTAMFLTPRAGATLAGVTTITWTATDPDLTQPHSRLEVTMDDGETWRLLYSGEGQTTTWDTTSEAEGPGYRLRLTATDGKLQARDERAGLSVRNIILAASPPDVDRPDDADPPTSDPVAPNADAGRGESGPDAHANGATEEGQARKVPAPFLGAAVLLAAAIARRRRG